MFSTIRFALVCASALALASPIQAQVPHNRQVQAVSVLPDPAGGHVVHAVWAAEVDNNTVPLDLSTEVEVRVNGTAVVSTIVPVAIDAGSPGCVGGPPCNGVCGSGVFDIQSATMTCHKDTDCTPAACDCDCGYWIATPQGLPTPLSPGDEIMVLLRPAPGALPEPDTSDDALITTFHGEAIGWNRGISDIVLNEVSPGMFEVQVVGSVGWETPMQQFSLDTEVELRINGVPIGTQNIPMEVNGILDQTCWQQGCGTTCGSVNGIPRHCDAYLWWTCACTGGWIAVFPPEPVDPDDEITIILKPAPGALPELPGFPEDDDEETRPCCEVVSVEDAGVSARARLEQNRPNPFNPTTTIRFDLVRPGDASIVIYDASGRAIQTLLDRNLTAGTWSVSWDGRLSNGSTAPSGTYFYRLTVDGVSETKAMTLLK